VVRRDRIRGPGDGDLSLEVCAQRSERRGGIPAQHDRGLRDPVPVAARAALGRVFHPDEVSVAMIEPTWAAISALNSLSA
jgi:hypothetical protein